MDITFKTGEFQHFIATRKFALGETGIDVTGGADVHFDGITVQFNGMEYTFPKLRGALKMGWLVPAEDYLAGNNQAPAPLSANVQVRHATQGGNPHAPPQRLAIPTTTSDERVVVNSTQRAQNVQARNIASRTASVNPRQLGGQQVVDQRGYAIVAEEQDGTPVRSLNTPAKATTELTGSNAYDAVKQASSATFTPAKGNPKSEEERLTEMSDADRESYLAKKAETDQRLLATKKGKAAPGGRPIVAQKIVTKTEGVTVSKGSEYTEDLSEATGPAKVTETVVDGIRITNTNGPGTAKRAAPAGAAAPTTDGFASKIEKDGTADVRRKIAKSIFPEFPDTYDFSDHWKKRLARIRLDFEMRPDIIKAIFAAESDDFKTVLVQEFPEVFASL